MRRRGRGRTAGRRDDDDLDREIAAEMAAVRQLSEGVIEQQRELMNDQAEVINRDFARAEDQPLHLASRHGILGRCWKKV